MEGGGGGAVRESIHRKEKEGESFMKHCIKDSWPNILGHLFVSLPNGKLVAGKSGHERT